MKKTIAVLPGDGIGPEVTAQAVQALKKVGAVFGHTFLFEYGLIGAAAIDKTRIPLPRETLQLCHKTDAILFGAIGDPKYDNDPSLTVRPEQGLLALRQNLGLFANIRPIIPFKTTMKASPLKEEIIINVDFVVVRELTGGIYFGKPRHRSLDRKRAVDTCVYTKAEILRVTKIAYDLASRRKQKVTLVDKANVLETSRLWRETVQQYSKKFSNITTDYMFVDNAAMQIIKNPSTFDVVLTDNMFGDILTDEASIITGSIGMLPSASLGKKTALFEPIHGSYPTAANKNIANPVGSILSAALMLEYSFGLKKEAKSIWRALEKTLESGVATQDINEKNYVSTTEFSKHLISKITGQFTYTQDPSL